MIEKKDVVEFIAMQIKETIPPEYHNLINDDFNMANNDLGFNSINFVMLVYELEKNYEISLEESLIDFSKYNTISLLSEFVTELINKK